MDVDAPLLQERASAGSARLHYLDSARALLMMLGIPVHAAMPYDDHWWHLNSAAPDALVGYIANFLQLFRMHAFFVIAGFFAAMMLGRRRPSVWMRSRAKRLLIPLLFATLVILPVQHGLLAFLHGGDPLGPLKGFASLSLPAPAQTWFIRDLFLFCCVAALAYAVFDIRPRDRQFSAAMMIAIALAFVILAATVTRALNWPLAALDHAHIATYPFHRGLFYFPFFAGGALLWLFPAYYQRFVHWSPPFVMLALVFLLLLGLAFYPPGSFYGLRNMLPGYLAGVVGTWAVLGLARRYLDARNRVVAFYVDGALTIYLIHVLFVCLFGALVIDRLGHPFVEWLILVCLAFVSSSAFYWMVREIPVLYYLFNGRFPPKRESLKRPAGEAQAVF